MGRFVPYPLYLNEVDFKESSQFGQKGWSSFLVQDREAKGPPENLALGKESQPRFALEGNQRKQS